MSEPTTYTDILRLTKPGSGSVATWGDRLNENFDVLDRHVASLKGTAAEVISGFDVIAMSGGLIYKADTDHATEARRIGLAIADGSDTTSGYVIGVKRGFIDLTASGLTPDLPIYLSATAGQFSTTPAYYTDGSYQYLGRTLAIDKIWFDPLPRTMPTTLECHAPIEEKDGTNDPAGNWGAPTWNATDNRSYRTVTLASSNVIDLWYEFELPVNFLGIPNNSYVAFSVYGKSSNAATTLQPHEIVDTAGVSITSGMPTATASTSMTQITLQGSVFNGGTFAAGGIVRVKVRATGGGAHTASLSTLATLRVPLKFF